MWIFHEKQNGMNFYKIFTFDWKRYPFIKANHKCYFFSIQSVLNKTLMFKMIAFIMSEWTSLKYYHTYNLSKMDIEDRIRFFFIFEWLFYVFLKDMTHYIHRVLHYISYRSTCVWFINFWFPCYFLCNLKFLSSWHL